MPQKWLGYYQTSEQMDNGDGNTRIISTLMVFFTGVTALIMWHQWMENRELVKTQKEIADIQLKKLNGGKTAPNEKG